MKSLMFNNPYSAIDALRYPPTANSQPPTANRQSPTANRQQPTANRQPPLAFTLIAVFLIMLFATPFSVSPAAAMDWRQGAFDATDWGLGYTPLGFGSASVETIIPDNRPTYYFRKLFFLPSTYDPTMTNLKLTVMNGEGLVVSFHGQEAGRSPWLPAGDLAYDTLSSSSEPSGIQEFDLTGILFQCENSIGNNWRTVSVEIHRQDPDASFSFDAVVSARIQGSWQDVVAAGERWQWYPDTGKPLTPPERVVAEIRYPLPGLPVVTKPGGSLRVVLAPDTDISGSIFILTGNRDTRLLEGGVIEPETEMGRGVVFELPETFVPDTYDLVMFAPGEGGAAFDQVMAFSPHSVAVLAAIDSSVSIVHISDSHLPYRGSYYPDTAQPLQRIWDGLPELQPDLVIHTGDGYNEGNFRDGAELFHKFVEECPSPILYIGGNHELGEWCGSGTSREHYWDFFGWPQMDPRQPDHWTGSTRDYVIDAGPVSFVCLETWTSYSSYWYDWYSYQSPTYAQIEWLRGVTGERSDQFMVACYHHDFDGTMESEVIPFFDFDMGLSGHTHSDEEYFVGPIPLYKVGSTYQASKPQRWFHFRNGMATGGSLMTADPVTITMDPEAWVPAKERKIVIRNNENSDIPGHKTWVPMVKGIQYEVSQPYESLLIGQWSGSGIEWVCVEHDLQARSQEILEIEPSDPESSCHLLAFHVEHPVFRSGETTSVSAVITNECIGNMVQVYIAFEAGGMFFFWPDWSQTPASETMFLSSGQQYEFPVLEVLWPDLPVYGQTVTFWGVVIDNDSGAVESPIAQTMLIY